MGHTMIVYNIPEQKGLDPIQVIFQDVGPGRGSVIITCYSRAWTAYWGAMGDYTVEEFFLMVEPTYIHSNMVRGMRPGLRKDDKYDEQYVTRIITAVQNYLRAKPSNEPADQSTG